MIDADEFDKYADALKASQIEITEAENDFGRAQKRLDDARQNHFRIRNLFSSFCFEQALGEPEVSA